MRKTFAVLFAVLALAAGRVWPMASVTMTARAPRCGPARCCR